MWFSPACLWWGCAFWPWWLLPCCRKRAAPFTMKKLSLRLQNKWERGVTSTETQTLYIRHHAAQHNRSSLFFGRRGWEVGQEEANEIFSFNRTVQFSRHSQRDEHKSWLPAAGELPQQLSGKAQLPRYRGRPAAAMNQALILNAYLSFFCCMGCTRIWLAWCKCNTDLNNWPNCSCLW